MTVDGRRADRRAAASLLVVVFVLVPLLWLLTWALIGVRNTCDESCGASSGWNYHAGSWLWSAQLWALMVPAGVAGVALLAAVWRGRPRAAWVALGAGVALLVGWFALMTAGGGDYIDASGESHSLAQGLLACAWMLVIPAAGAAAIRLRGR